VEPTFSSSQGATDPRPPPISKHGDAGTDPRVLNVPLGQRIETVLNQLRRPDSSGPECVKA
jgi:hypothetical protein